MSDDNVKTLSAVRALKTGDNRLWSPLDCLRDCIKDIETNERPCDKLLILRLVVTPDNKGDKFDVGYNAAQLKGSEILAMLECCKALIMQEMGYIE